MQKTTYKRTEQTKRKLLNAFMELIKEKGYENVTIRDICNRSGISNGAFYHQYGSKDALAQTAYLQVDFILTPEFMDEINALPPMEGLYELFKAEMKYIAEDAQMVTSEYYKLLLNVKNENEYKKNRPYYQAVLHLVNICIQNNIVKWKISNEIVDYLFQFTRGLIFDWCIHNGSYDLVHRFDKYFVVLCEGILM